MCFTLIITEIEEAQQETVEDEAPIILAPTIAVQELEQSCEELLLSEGTLVLE